MEHRNTEGKGRRPSRTRDPRMDDLHSQVPSCDSSATRISNSTQASFTPTGRASRLSHGIADSHLSIIPPLASTTSVSSNHPSVMIDLDTSASRTTLAASSSSSDKTSEEIENSDMLYIARLSVSTKAKKLGCLSAPVL